MSQEEQGKQQQPEPSRREWILPSDSEDWRIKGPSASEEGGDWRRPEWERPEERTRGSRHLAFVFALGLGLLALVAGVLFLPGHEEEEEQEIPFGTHAGEGPQLSEVFDARLLWSTPLAWQEEDGTPSPDSAAMPSDMAVVGDRVFVLDTNNGRILELGGDGRAIDVWDEATDKRLLLGGAMAMAAHEDELYVANSAAGNVLVVDLTGHVERVITPEGADGANPLRPIGIDVGADGHIVLSDPDNHRVLSLDEDGQLVWSIGSGHRDSGQYGLNSPGAVYLDAWGYLYVVDMLNYAVKKYSPEGEFVMSLGEAGDTEGTFSRPKGIAVDDEGNIFVSDGLLVVVQVFGADGSYLGFIGREDPRSEQSANLFEAPQGMKVVDDNLYVVDRFTGLFAFQIGL